MARMAAVLGVAMALGLPWAAEAQVQLGDEDQFLSIAGKVTADQKAATQFGISGVSIGFAGQPPDKLVWIGVVKAESWNGDVFAGQEMLTTAAGYTPTMLASGKSAPLAKLRQVPVGSRIVVEGIFNQSARTFLVGMVEVTPPGASK